ncbi:hypothetical protein GQ44DRAFT_554500, partial [Phaeosphaeriaceae sp. PMI808]
PQTPLRTALIGLSSTAATSWASAVHLPGLLSPRGRALFSITALLNSSTAAAHSAISTYQLPPSTKAYGSPADLAADPDVDLVICNTRVDKHFETVLPSVKAGKDVFIEWPIASSRADRETLMAEARKSGSRVAIGLQRRWSPPVVKLREVLAGGKLGKVLSADVRAYGGTLDREILPVALKYFAEREVGGNPIVIGFAHCFDFVLSVLGEIDPETVSTKLQLQRPEVRVRDSSTKQIVEKVTSNVPDLLSLHAGLLPSEQTVASATLSVLFRRGQPFPGTAAFTLTISCENGEIQLLSPSSTSLESEEDSVTIHVHWFGTDEVEEVEWKGSKEGLSVKVQSVLDTLVAFAERREGGDGWVSLEDAARRA